MSTELPPSPFHLSLPPYSLGYKVQNSHQKKEGWVMIGGHPTGILYQQLACLVHNLHATCKEQASIPQPLALMCLSCKSATKLTT